MEDNKPSTVHKIKVILNDLVETEAAPSDADIASCKEMIQDYFLNRKQINFLAPQKVK